jgi:hypothetical protein
MKYKSNKRTKWFYLAFLFIFLIGIFILSSTDKVEFSFIEMGGEKESAFSDMGLQTNTGKSLIDLELVLTGTSRKDNIPALTSPSFVAQEEVNYLEGSNAGIVVESGGEVRFYPYNILVWHEIVNDIFSDGTKLTVTFCPLCGSAIVFESGGDEFGVSGKLYESNLLMYDKETDSLWSQIEGRAVVGDRIGDDLTIYPSQVMQYSVFQEKHPESLVLSDKTGYLRDYTFYPYGGYEESNSLLFPVSISDQRLPVKEIMYIVNTENHSVALKDKSLNKEIVSIDTPDGVVTAHVVDGEVVVKNIREEVLPGYTAMWFSWVNHNQESGIVWTGE